MAKRRRFRRYRSYPRRKYRSFRKGKSPIPLLPLIPTVNSALLQPIFGDGARWGAAKFIQNGDPAGAIMEAGNILSMNFTGYSLKGPDAGTFYPHHLINTYTPIAVGLAGHFIAQKLGVNRMMKKIPMVGKYISL